MGEYLMGAERPDGPAIIFNLLPAAFNLGLPPERRTRLESLQFVKKADSWQCYEDGGKPPNLISRANISRLRYIGSWLQGWHDYCEKR